MVESRHVCDVKDCHVSFVLGMKSWTDYHLSWVSVVWTRSLFTSPIRTLR